MVVVDLLVQHVGQRAAADRADADHRYAGSGGRHRNRSGRRPAERHRLAGRAQHVGDRLHGRGLRTRGQGRLHGRRRADAADPPGADAAVRRKPLQRGTHLMHVVPKRQPRAAGPFLPVGKQPAVGKEQIDTRQPQALQAGGQAALDQAERSARRRPVQRHLGGDPHPGRKRSAERGAHRPLGPAVAAVGRGHVDVIDAGIDRGADGGDRLVQVSFVSPAAHQPGAAQGERAHLAQNPERTPRHEIPLAGGEAVPLPSPACCTSAWSNANDRARRSGSD